MVLLLRLRRGGGRGVQKSTLFPFAAFSFNHGLKREKKGENPQKVFYQPFLIYSPVDGRRKGILLTFRIFFGRPESREKKEEEGKRCLAQGHRSKNFFPCQPGEKGGKGGETK